MTKLATLPTANELLDTKYGADGTTSRAAFDAESVEWYEAQTERGSYHITMPKALHETLRRQANKSGVSISAFVSNLLSRELSTV